MFWRSKCERQGHDWLMDDVREFVPIEDICLRCGVRMNRPPWGECLGGHPLAEHYDEKGVPIRIAHCVAPR